MSDLPAPCGGVWERHRNTCRCQSCRNMERARGEYLDAQARVMRLELAEAPKGLSEARAAREAAGKRWAALGRANPDYGKSAGTRFVPASAAYSRPQDGADL